MKGRITINTGSMFSGKTTELLRQGKRHILGFKKVIYIKPDIDVRYSETKVVSHDGEKSDFDMSAVLPVNADITKFIQGLKNDIKIILVDEVQFFNETIAEQLNELANEGYIIYCSGLDLDFKGSPFRTTMQIMAYADNVNKLKAVCSVCGADAHISDCKVQDITDTDGVIKIGGAESYRALCRDCHSNIYIPLWDDDSSGAFNCYDRDCAVCGGC